MARGKPKVRRHFEAEVDLIELVSYDTGVSIDQLKGSTRGVAYVSRARQIYLYLLHTVFGYPMVTAGAVVGRDRTTVRHASATIEDLRETGKFGKKMDELERAAQTIKDRHWKSN